MNICSLNDTGISLQNIWNLHKMSLSFIQYILLLMMSHDCRIESYLCFVSTGEKSEPLSFSDPSLTEDVSWRPSERLFKTRCDTLFVLLFCLCYDSGVVSLCIYCNYHVYDLTGLLHCINRILMITLITECTGLSLSYFLFLSGEKQVQCFSSVRDTNKKYKIDNAGLQSI